METVGVTYFIRAETGQIKIGFSNRPTGRLDQLQVGCPVLLAMLGTIPSNSQSLERHLHRKFERHHLRGEWFHPAPDLLQEIVELLDGTSPLLKHARTDSLTQRQVARMFRDRARERIDRRKKERTYRAAFGYSKTGNISVDEWLKDRPDPAKL